MPLCDYTSEWIVNGTFVYQEFIHCQQDIAVDNTTITYTVSGDTLLNGISYLKINQHRVDSSNCVSNPLISWVTESDMLAYIIREESNVLYLYDTFQGEESILYDYNEIEIGTVLSNDCTVASIDTLYLLYQPYLRYNCDCDSEFLVQAAGTKRLFNAPLNCGIGIEGDWANVCYSKNGFSIQLHEEASCIDTGDPSLYGPDSMESNSKQTLQISPNPTREKIRIKLAKPSNGIISLMTMKGRAILIQSFENQMQMELNLRDTPTGVYLLQLQDGESVLTRKVLVLD